MHDAHIKRSFVSDDVASEFAFSHAPFPMQVVEHLDVPVEFERSALPFRLLYAQY